MNPTLAKFILAAGCLLISFLMFWLKGRTRHIVLLTLAAIILYRAALFYVMFIHFRLPVPIDVSLTYIPLAYDAMNGLVVYRDFETSYGPLFPYLSAGLLWLWHSDKVFPLVAGIMEILTVLVFIVLARKKSEDYAGALILYSACLIPLWSSIVFGANNSWLALCLALAWLTNESKHPMLSGFCMAFGILAVKLIGILFVPFLFARSRNRTLWMTGFLLPILVVNGGLWALGANPLQPILYEAGNISSGNLSYLLGIFGKQVYSILSLAGMGLAAIMMAALSLYVLFRPPGYKPALAISFIAFVAFMALWPKSYALYFSLCLFPICLLEKAHWATVLAFGLLGLVGELDVALYVTMAKEKPLYMADINTQIVLISTCALLLAGYFVFIFRQTVALRRSAALCHGKVVAGGGLSCVADSAKRDDP